MEKAVANRMRDIARWKNPQCTRYCANKQTDKRGLFGLGYLTGDHTMDRLALRSVSSYYYLTTAESVSSMN